MNAEIIKVTQAQIRTATVELKIITVDKKQMTLAVFRQLPDLPLHQYDWRGTVTISDAAYGDALWGRVNYHVDCKEYGHHEHIHVIYEVEGILYKTIVYKEAHFWGHMPNTDAYNALYAVVSNLDQLYIAV